MNIKGSPLNFLNMKAFALLLLFSSLMGYCTLIFSDELRIAVRASKGATEAMASWQATADYLNQKIPEHHFSIVPFENNSALNQSISSQDTLISITNPAASVELKIRYGHQLLATLVNSRLGQGYAQFGSVVFTRADRGDINNFSDLKGKIFLGVDELGFGGWRIAWGEFLKQNIDPYHDFKELRFAGGNQTIVVHSVLEGKADAGTVRTDMLEGLAAAGDIQLSEIKVLEPKQATGFPFLLSSDLYPEWYFSVSNTLPNALQRKIERALLAIPKNSPAAVTGGYVGWIRAVDTAPVEDLLKKLKVGPYRVTQAGLLKEFVRQYAVSLAAILLLMMSLAYAFFYVTKLNRRITQTQVQLKAEIASREQAEQALTLLAQQSLEFAKGEQFFQLCLTELAQLFAVKYAFIGLFASADKDRIKTYAVWAGDRFVDNFEYALAGTPCQDILNLDVELIQSQATQQYPEDALLREMGIESYFGAPLISPAGEMMGLVSVFDIKPMQPSKDLQALFKVFVNRISMEIQRKQEEEALQGMAAQLSYQASHDVLTNLVNRREFETRTQQAWNSAKAQHRHHALCFLDLDHFKVVNDTCGHQAGDALLLEISNTLSTIVRGSDTLARLGGDEFGVLLLDCPMDRARGIADKLLEAVKQFRFHHQGEVFEVGVSIGVAPIHPESRDMQALFQAADRACYVAKSLGRNRIHMHVEKAA